MKLTYDGDFGAVPEQFGGEVGFGMPDFRALAMPDRGTSLLGTFDRNYMEQIARDNAWRAPAANEPQHWAGGKSVLELMQGK